MTEAVKPGIRLALISPNDDIIVAWPTADIGKRFVASVSAGRVNHKLTQILRPKRAAKTAARVEAALVSVLEDCFTDLIRL